MGVPFRGVVFMGDYEDEMQKIADIRANRGKKFEILYV